MLLFDNCKLFKDIALVKSLSRAADRSGISQSAASQQVQDLEKRLGVPLLDRSTRPFTLTEAGKLYYALCRDVLRREEDFLAALDQLKSTVEGEVRVASIYSIGISELQQIKQEFSARYPKADLRVDYMRPDKIYGALLAGAADIGLVSYPEPTKELAVIPWRNEEMAVVASPLHFLAQSSVLLPSDLAGYDFVTFDEDLTIRRELDRFFRDQGVEIRITMQFDNIEMIKGAVALGSGISILPRRTVQGEVDLGRLVAIPLLAPGLARPVGIVHRKRKRFNRATQLLLELLRKAPAP